MIYKFPTEIKSNYNGYETFVDLYHKIKDYSFSKIYLDFDLTTWFDANLCAVMGAILARVTENVNEIYFQGLSESLEDLFKRNHFLSHFGGVQLPDNRLSCIEYRKFKTTDEKLFKNYLDNDLLSTRAMPVMSKQLKKRINESLFEVFNNAVNHGHTKYIFSCGQYYPRKKCLDFTIVDLGTTIKKNVNKYLNISKNGSEAILWAIEEGHTTRTGNIPGGLGLSFTRDFIRLNEGTIQIISSTGFWQQNKRSTQETKELASYFPGTIVNFEFRTDDGSMYSLANENEEALVF